MVLISRVFFSLFSLFSSSYFYVFNSLFLSSDSPRFFVFLLFFSTASLEPSVFPYLCRITSPSSIALHYKVKLENFRLKINFICQLLVQTKENLHYNLSFTSLIHLGHCMKKCSTFLLDWLLGQIKRTSICIFPLSRNAKEFSRPHLLASFDQNNRRPNLEFSLSLLRPSVLPCSCSFPVFRNVLVVLQYVSSLQNSLGSRLVHTTSFIARWV